MFSPTSASAPLCNLRPKRAQHMKLTTLLPIPSFTELIKATSADTHASTTTVLVMTRRASCETEQTSSSMRCYLLREEKQMRLAFLLADVAATIWFWVFPAGTGIGEAGHLGCSCFELEHQRRPWRSIGKNTTSECEFRAHET